MAIAREGGSSDLVPALEQFGRVLLAAERHEDALDAFGEAREHVEPDELAARAQLSEQIANAWRELGQRHREELERREAVRLYLASGDRAAAADASSRLGLCLLEQDRPDEAVRLLSQARNELDRLRRPWAAAWATYRLGQALLAEGRPRGRRELLRAYRRFRRLEARAPVVMALTALSEAARERGDLTAARRFIEETPRWLARPDLDRRQTLRAEGQAMIARGRLAHSQGRDEEAIAAFKRAQDAFQVLDELAGQILALSGLIGLCDDPEHLLARQATELIERHRARLTDSDLRMNVFGVTANAVRTSIRGSLLAGRPEEALEKAERTQARELTYWLSVRPNETDEAHQALQEERRLWQELHRALVSEPPQGDVAWAGRVEQLRHRYRRASRRLAAASRVVEPPTLGQLSGLIGDDGAALVEPILDDPVGDVLVLAGNTLTAFEVPARSKLERHVDRVCRSVERWRASPGATRASSFRSARRSRARAR